MEAIDTAPRPKTQSSPPVKLRQNLFGGFFFLALSLFFLGMGMKLLMLQRCVNPLPYFDQWEGEAAAIYVPYYEHALTFADLFHPQHEHRIFLTHIYDLILLLLNGQWDSQLQMVVNAVIHSATIAVFAWLMAALMGRRYWPFIWFPLAVAVMSPYGWENALWGFQSQFYFLLLFSLLTIWLLGSRPLSTTWRWGVVAGACALLTMASGLLASVAVGIIVVLEILRNRSEWRRHIPTLLVCAVLAGVGMLMKGKHYAAELLQAQSVKEFICSLGNNLTWPVGLLPWLAPLNLFPLVLLGWFYLRRCDSERTAERVLLGIGIWTILQSAATAYARGAGGVPPTWRYMDTLVFLFVANFLSVVLVIGNYRKQLRFPWVWYAAFAIWLVLCLNSLCTLNQRAWNVAIPRWAERQNTRLESFRAFMANDDPTVFTNRDTRDMPFVFVPELVFLLHSKDIRPILPACGRDPLKLTSKEHPPSIFMPGGVRLDKSDPPTEFCLGNYSTNGPVRGTFESITLASSLPYLEIPVAGNLAAPGLNLELVDLASGKVSEIKPDKEPGGKWVNVDVKSPSGQFKLVARSESPTGWFAFKEPRELGRLSYWAQKTIGMGKYALVAGCLAFAAAIGCYFLPRKSDKILLRHLPKNA